jgi:carboxylesterase
VAVLDLIPGAEPFFFPGGPFGCLLLHGFTGTPYEVRGLGEHLAGHGYTAYGPRLALHGSQPADLNRGRWHDWYLSALDGWHLLRSQCPAVAVVGVSMGGLLALLLASREPLAAVITLNTPARLPEDWRLRFVRPLSYVIRYTGKEPQPDAPPMPQYWVYPSRGVAQLAELVAVAKAALPAVTAPALVLHSRVDPRISPESLDELHAGLGSADKRAAWIDCHDHVPTVGPASDFVFAEVLDFLEEVKRIA